jgi:hypothetical protein
LRHTPRTQQTHPRQWQHLPWRHRGDPTRPPVTIRTGDQRFAIPGTVVVQSYRDVYTDYRQHPETKAATPTGDPVIPGTAGLLAPATITASGVDRIGKEANRLTDDDNLIDGDDDQAVLYTARTCRGCNATVVGKRQWCSDACRKRTARSTWPQQQLRRNQRATRAGHKHPRLLLGWEYEGRTCPTRGAPHNEKREPGPRRSSAR